MSYSILLKDTQGQLTEIPFSGQQTFNQFWQPLLLTLNLTTIANIQYGYELSRDELVEFIDELKIAKQHANTDAIKERIDFLIIKLQEIVYANYSSIYIG